MKNLKKLRALVLLVALLVVIALGTLVYPWLSRQAEQESLQAEETVENAADDTQSAEPAGDAADDEQTAEPAANADDAAPAEESVPVQTAPPDAGVAGPVFRQMATDFTAYDMQGAAIRLSDYRGTPVIVNFFASWCGPCRMELPYFEAAYHEYGEQICFLMVDLNAYGNDTAEAALAMIEEGGYTFPVYFDSDGEAAVGYSVRSIPTTLLVGADGDLIGTKIGAMSEAMLGEAIAKLLATVR